METKYKSSKFATYSQYIAVPIIIGFFLYYLYLLLIGSVVTREELFFFPFWFWASIVVIINSIKLRYVKVTESNILTKSLLGEEVLLYKDIEWINQNIFGSNWYIITIKYKDIKKGKSKIIFVFPEMYTARENLSFYKELNMTKYIREQILKVNTSYRVEDEPSRWYLTKWIFLSFLPFIIISFLLIV